MCTYPHYVGGILPEFAEDVADAPQLPGDPAKAAKNQLFAISGFGTSWFIHSSDAGRQICPVLFMAEPDPELPSQLKQPLSAGK